MALPVPVAGLPVGTPATVSGNDITVSALLNNPRIIERRVKEVSDLRYWADQILPNTGPTGAGVAIYQEWAPDIMAMDRKPEEVAPDAEVPLAGSFEGERKVVQATLDGLGYVVTDDMKRWNQRYVMDDREKAMSYTMADHFNTRAVAVITASISANSRTLAATDWSALVTDGGNPDPAGEWPHSTLALVNAQQTEARIPWALDSMLAHPLDIWRLATIYLKDSPITEQIGQIPALRQRLGLATLISDNTGDVPRGSPILFSSGNVGGTLWDLPVASEIIPERRRRRTVVQFVGSAAYFVDNAYGLLQLTGTAVADLAA